MSTKFAVLAMALVLMASSADAQDRRVRTVPRPVPGSYIVVLAGTDDPEAVGRETETLYRGRLKGVFRRVVRGFAAQLTADAATRLANDPRVLFVEQDEVVRASDTQASPPWGLDRIDQRSLPLDHAFSYGRGDTPVYVHVIDTGIRTTHVEFGGRAFIGGDFVDDDNNSATDPANDDSVPGQPDGADCHGHGTHVAGTIAGATAGVAKHATVFAYRALDCSGNGSTSTVIGAIETITATTHRPAVVNMSLNGEASLALDDAVRRSIAAGITYVVAAGNSGQDASSYSPARVVQAITVGATDNTDTRPTFSNYGSTVDLFAPGVDIASAWYTSDTAATGMSGTSMASPHVAGIAALYLEQVGDRTPAEVRQALVESATAGRIINAGAGSPNLLAYSSIVPPGGGGGPTGPVTYVGTDTTTQGNWKGVYGNQGSVIVGDSTSLPAGTAVTAGGAMTWTWAATSTDPRALQRGAAGSNRVAATWYQTTFVVDVAIPTGASRRLSVYFLDWDFGNRGEVIAVEDPTTGAVLDTRTVSSFTSGKYLTWNISGNVRLRVTKTAGGNAVVSGVFIDDAPSGNLRPTVAITSPLADTMTPAPATFSVTADAADADGTIAQVDFFVDGAPLASDNTAPYAFTWSSVPAGTYTLTARATDNLGASTTSNPITVTVVGDGAVTYVGADTTTQGTWKTKYGTRGYVVVGDSTSLPSGTTVTALRPSTWTWAATTSDVRALQQATASSRIASTWFHSAFYIDVTVPDGESRRLAVYLLDWDRGGRSEIIEVVNPFSGAVLDTRTVTGFSGGTYLVWTITGSVRVRVTTTSSTNAVVSGVFLDDVTTTNQRPVVSMTSPANGASASAPATFTLSADAADLDGTITQVAFSVDGAPLAIDNTAPYAVTWSSVPAGTYTLTATATDNQGATTTSSPITVTVLGEGMATYVGTDTTTQGTWKSTYGTQGYVVVGDTTSLPLGTTVTATGAFPWTWSATTTDVRALERGAAPGRIAATWYNSSFVVDVAIPAGESRRLAIYVLDWDAGYRSQAIELLNPTTGAVLDTRTVNTFTGGKYLVWNITGTVRVRLRSTGASNAVVNAVFLDPR